MRSINSDHKKLINSIKLLFDSTSSLSDILVLKRTSYSEQGEIIQWLNHQFMILEDSFNLLLKKNAYKSVFANLRSVFESYWVLHLAMNGIKYYKYFKARTKKIAQRIYNKWKTDLGDFHSKELHKNILNVELINKNIKVTYIGLFNKNNKNIIPYYYFLFKEYEPLKAYLGREPRLIDNYLTSPYITRKNHINQREINSKYFVFSKGVYDHLLLNKFIDRKKWQRINVHYNFLSMWVHPNIYSVSMIDGNVIGVEDTYKSINEKYNFYLTRLALLYIGSLLKLFLKSFLVFVKRQKKENKIKDIKDKLLIRRIKKFESITDYFWFIYNKPHFAYKWQYCMYRIWKSSITGRKLKILMPADVPNSLVPYYENPLEILKKIHGSYNNKIIGKIKDPFK